MAKKRQTKQGKISSEIAALEQRLADMAMGAAGWLPDDGENSSGGLFWPEDLQRWTDAVRITFNGTADNQWQFSHFDICKFTTPHKLAVFLYGRGVRA